MVDAGNKAGMKFDIGDNIRGRMEEASFIDNQLRLDLGVAGFCSRPFTNHMGLSPQEIQVFCARLRSAFRDEKLKWYQWAYFVYG
ncbi:hypothetical protein AC578_4620 [Pseudocercospora eumusae]|uniref:Uncharacterized protein n=1 Tax=Pseudocercospora eumusae TaxID=321146 RepID=A0A139GZ85_9PEZI|nr:hypothetical protein AC578_4620 [Pseudocercospora eumusae]